MKDYFEKREQIKKEVQTLNKPVKELYWPVYYEDVNGRKIEVKNVFNLNWPMLAAFYCINKCCKDESAFDFFSKMIAREIGYELWARCQYEVVITSWPVYITAEELESLKKEETEAKEKGHNFCRTSVDPDIGIKVDVAQQIMMNWDNFIAYLWNNRKLLKKYKEYAEDGYCKNYLSVFKRDYKDWKAGKLYE